MNWRQPVPSDSPLEAIMRSKFVAGYGVFPDWNLRRLESPLDESPIVGLLAAFHRKGQGKTPELMHTRVSLQRAGVPRYRARPISPLEPSTAPSRPLTLSGFLRHRRCHVPQDYVAHANHVS